MCICVIPLDERMGAGHHETMRRILLFLVIIGIIAGGAFLSRNIFEPVLLPQFASEQTPSYQSSGFPPITIDHVDDVVQITNIEITPDGKYMLVGTLPGTVWIYHRVDGIFRRQKEPFFNVKTAQPGWPPQEAGLTGIALGADFETSSDVFLFYSFAKEKRSFRNRVVRVRFTNVFGRVKGFFPRQIFEANTPGTGSHQIQDGVGVMVSGKPHVLFTVGEGFVAERALKPDEEAGKLMLLSREGEAKVQGLGIRNAPGIARSPNGMVLVADTGPNNYDRLLYGKFFDENGDNSKLLSFNWDGTEESLIKEALDPYNNNKNALLYSWSPTETAVSLAFLDDEHVYVVLFGRTGEPGNEPGKEIILGTIHENGITFTPFLARKPDVADKLGHPIGIALDPQTKDIYFGDIIEGRLYKARIGGENK